MPRYIRSVPQEREREERSSGYRRPWDEPEDYSHFLSEARQAVFQQTKEVIRQGREFDRMQHQRAIRERKFLNSAEPPPWSLKFNYIAGTSVPVSSPTGPLSPRPSEMGSPGPLSPISPLSLTVPEAPAPLETEGLSPLDPSSIVYPWEVTSPGPGAEPSGQPVWEQSEVSVAESAPEPAPIKEDQQAAVVVDQAGEGQQPQSEVYRMLAELREDEVPVEGEIKSFVGPSLDLDRGAADRSSAPASGRTRFVWRAKGGWQGTLAKTAGGYQATINQVQSTLQTMPNGLRPMSALHSPARLQPTYSVPAVWSVPPSPTASRPATPSAQPGETKPEEKEETTKEPEGGADEVQAPAAVQAAIVPPPASPKAQPLVPSMIKKKQVPLGQQPWVGARGKTIIL